MSEMNVRRNKEVDSGILKALGKKMGHVYQAAIGAYNDDTHLYPMQFYGALSHQIEEVESMARFMLKINGVIFKDVMRLSMLRLEDMLFGIGVLAERRLRDKVERDVVGRMLKKDG